MHLFSELVQMTSSETSMIACDGLIEHLIIDTRKILMPGSSLFFAIRGERNDGHAYIKEAYDKGITNFILEEADELKGLNDVNYIIVKDTLAALQAIAQKHREQFQCAVMGISGSNGKTIVKEWLTQLLQEDEFIVKSPRSYNSQIGVPLSVWQMRKAHTIGVFEAGISKPGEMAKLAQVIQPTIGIFTNIGSAHDEGFASREEKVDEKLQLFKAGATVIYCKDHQLIHDKVTSHQEIKPYTWSKEGAADLMALSEKKSNRGTSLKLVHQGKSELWLELPFTDNASVENVLHCITALLFLGKSHEYILKGLKNLRPMDMRLNLLEGINSCLLIDDTYNNDLAGLKTALDFLSQQTGKTHKTVILSDVLESGMEEKVLYNTIANYLKDAGVSRLVGIGKVFMRQKEAFDNNAVFYESLEAFTGDLDTTAFRNELLLIKGARQFKFERLVNLFQQRAHGTVLEVNLESIVKNLNFFKSRLKPETKIMAMVKAFAYGSGSHETATILQYYHIDYLAVAYADEGVALRQNGIKVPIMVMNPSTEAFEQLIAYNLEPEIYSFSLLEAYIRFLENKKAEGAVHIKIDTGMHRLGFDASEADKIVSLIQSAKNITVASVFSHLAGSDEEALDDFTKAQFDALQKAVEVFNNTLGYRPTTHILNSSGIVRFPEYQLDMVRLGLGLYGVDVTGSVKKELSVVNNLFTTISQIKTIKKGETVGYGRKGKAEEDMKIGVLAIGYADGFDRRLSNGVGSVWINEKLAPVIGNVCMDMTMVDLTGIDAREGDRVEVFGEHIGVNELAKRMDTIPYELFTNISERVKRVFYSE